MNTDLDLSGIAESRTETHEALQATAAAAQREREQLARVADDVAARIAELDALLEALPTGVAGGEASSAAVSGSPSPSAEAPAPPGAGAGTNGHRVGDVAEEVLREAPRALTFEALADRVAEEVGGDVDRRGLAGALNSGKRSGRFAKTPSGRWKSGG